LAELFGYVVQTGTVTWVSLETNFTDCHLFPLMIDRIIQIYTEQWNERPIRKNHLDHPRLCGYKTTRFVLAVCPLQHLQPGFERVPQFVWDTYEQLPVEHSIPVLKGFFKGLLGSAPKFWQLLENSETNCYNGLRIFFRSGQLYEESLSLLRYVLNVSCTAEHGTILFDLNQLQTFKQEFDLDHPSWWTTNESRWG
jgi:hypothetical protein